MELMVPSACPMLECNDSQLSQFPNYTNLNKDGTYSKAIATDDRNCKIWMLESPR